MDYQRIYNDFIADRIKRQDNIDGYSEKHHIIPKSLGGSNSRENLIILTAQDHIFAHSLLAKIHGGKMWHAYWMMSNSKRYKESRSMYELAKKNQSIIVKKRLEKYITGRKKTQDEIVKISNSLKLYFEKNPAKKGFKRDLTEEQRRIMSDKVKLRLSKNGHPRKGVKLTNEHIEKMRSYMNSDRNHFKGKVMSEHQKRKIGKAQMGKLNHAYKKEVYVFNHPIHGEFIGTQNDLMHEFNLKKNGVSRLCRKEYGQHKQWVITKELGI